MPSRAGWQGTALLCTAQASPWQPASPCFLQGLRSQLLQHWHGHSLPKGTTLQLLPDEGRWGPRASGVTVQLLKAAVHLKVLGWSLGDVYLCHAATTAMHSPAGMPRVRARCLGRYPALGGPAHHAPPHEHRPASPQLHLIFQHPPQVPRAPSSDGPPIQELLINVNWEQPHSTGGKSL